MPSSTVPKLWRVADVTFVEIEIRHPYERQMLVEFGCGLRIVITDASRLTLEPHDMRKSFNGLAALTPPRAAAVRSRNPAAT